MAVAACVLALISLISTSAVADTASARREYESALQWLREGHLARAKVAFERAYQESPHPIVLYNLARVCRDLGELSAAEDYFTRYRTDAEGSISDSRRAEIDHEIAEIRQQRGRDAPDSTQTPYVASAESGSTDLDSTSLPKVSSVSLMSRSFHLRTAAAVQRARWTGIALGTGGAGLITMVLGGVVALSARSERQELEANRAMLAEKSEIEIVPGDRQSLREAQQQATDWANTNARLDSTKRFEMTGWIGVATGATLLGSAVAVWYFLGESTHVAVGSSFISVRTEF